MLYLARTSLPGTGCISKGPIYPPSDPATATSPPASRTSSLTNMYSSLPLPYPCVPSNGGSQTQPEDFVLPALHQMDGEDRQKQAGISKQQLLSIHEALGNRFPLSSEMSVFASSQQPEHTSSPLSNSTGYPWAEFSPGPHGPLSKAQDTRFWTLRPVYHHQLLTDTKKSPMDLYCNDLQDIRNSSLQSFSTGDL